MKRLLLFLMLAGSLRGQNICTTPDPDLMRKPSIFGALRLWANQSKTWPKGSTLRISFIEGNSTLHERAWKYFQQIDNMCGLTFVQVPKGQESEIRVSFRTVGVGAGSWSYVGRDCLSVSQRLPTMNIGLTRWDSWQEWQRVCLHEGAHGLLGMEHEHASPLSSIGWDKEAVYSYYARTQGWSKTHVNQQVLNRSMLKGTIGTEYDPKSIMCYPIPRELLIDKSQATGWNRSFSEMDLEFVRKVYPNR